MEMFFLINANMWLWQCRVVGFFAGFVYGVCVLYRVTAEGEYSGVRVVI